MYKGGVVGGCGTAFQVVEPDKRAATRRALLAVASRETRRVFAYSIRLLCASCDINVDEILASIEKEGGRGGAA